MNVEAVAIAALFALLLTPVHLIVFVYFWKRRGESARQSARFAMVSAATSFVFILAFAGLATLARWGGADPQKDQCQDFGGEMIEISQADGSTSRMCVVS